MLEDRTDEGPEPSPGGPAATPGTPEGIGRPPEYPEEFIPIPEDRPAEGGHPRLPAEAEEDLFDTIGGPSAKPDWKEAPPAQPEDVPYGIPPGEMPVKEKLEDEVEHTIASSVGGEIFEEELGKLEEYFEHEAGVRSGRTDFESGLFEMIEESEFQKKAVFLEDRRQQQMFSAEILRNVNRRQFMESGSWFYKQGLYARAVEEFRKATQADPSSSEAFRSLGDAFFKLGQTDKAIESYEKAKTLDPDNLDVLENLGVVLANRGEYKKAVWQWGEVLKRNPERKDIVERIKRMQRVLRQRSL